MTVNIYWDAADKTRLVLEFSQSVTWEEFQSGVQQAHTLITGVDENVDLVIWAKTPLPESLVLARFRAAFEAQPPNIGLVIIVPQENPRMQMFARVLAGVMLRLFLKKSKIVFVENMEEARKLSQKSLTF